MTRIRIAIAVLVPAAVLAASLAGGAARAGAQEPSPAPEQGVLDAFGGGTVSLSLRYRFEGVWDDDPRYTGGDGYASTLRTVLGYRTANYKGFTAAIEFENVADLGLGNEHNNSGAGGLGNGITDRPGIADPEITEVNQVTLRFEGIPRTTVDLGRREMSLADERFLGPVGWRQNHQSMDGLHVTQKSIPRTTLVYAFLHNVNRIFGDNHPMASHLLDASVALSDRITVAPYFYFLDYERDANAGLSTMTAGARGTGSLALGKAWRLPFHLEAAWQGDAGDNPGSYDVAYYRVEAGVERGAFTIGAGYEVLGGETGKGAFATPLATLHKWNGWADKFLTTPADGLTDLWGQVKAKKSGFSGALAYHAFSADSGGATYGQELDVEAAYETSWKQTVAAKLALYMADEFSTDTQKLWLYTSYGF